MNFDPGLGEGMILLLYYVLLIAAIAWVFRAINRFLRAHESIAESLREIARTTLPK